MKPFDPVRLARSLAHDLEGLVEIGRPLARLTTYRVGGPAALFVEPAHVADLAGLARALTAAGDVPVLVLGRGSNLVVSDRGWQGVVIRLPAEEFAWIAPLDHRDGLNAGAATSLPMVANWAARRGLAGAEFLVAVPGSVGGAVRMNAGAHGQEVKDCLASARVFDIQRLEIETRVVESFEFDYRRSNLGDRELVLDATFRLEPSDPEQVRTRMEGYRRHRADTQPGAVQNAGSVFKNPVGDHAGRLVEASGLKGFRVGGARVSELHANFFIAEQDATAQEVFELVARVRERVRESCGVDLEPEIRFVGEFDAPRPASRYGTGHS